MIRSVYYIIFCVLIVSCNEKRETPQVYNGNSELESFITDYYSVMSRRDWDTYREFFTDKAILTTIWQEPDDPEPALWTSTITEFLAQTGNGPDSQPIFEESPLKIDIRLKNNLASAWVNYEAKFGTEDNLMEWKGIDLFSFLKFNDKWYITSITYVSDETEY